MQPGGVAFKRTVRLTDCHMSMPILGASIVSAAAITVFGTAPKAYLFNK